MYDELATSTRWHDDDGLVRKKHISSSFFSLELRIIEPNQRLL